MAVPEENPYQVALRQLQDFGLEVAEIETTGTRKYAHHVDDRRGTKKGWYVAHSVRLDSGQEIIVGCYGWYKEPDTAHKFKFDLSQASEQTRLEARRKAAEADRLSQLMRQEAAREAAERASKIWSGLPDAGASGYLDRKGVRAFGLRFSRGSVVVPLRIADNRMVGLQFIDGEGQKRFLTGTAKLGAFHMIGDPGSEPPLIGIAEGYATAATVHMARRMQWPIAVAFDAGNLKPVALALRARWPNAMIVVLADDDRTTPGNPGRTKAEAVVKAVGGAMLLPPLGDHIGSDWNDLQQAIGVDGVREALAVAWEAAKPAQAARSNVVQLQTGADWRVRLQRNDKGVLRATAFNLRLILESDPAWNGVLGWCEFSARIMKKQLPPYGNASRGEWTDADDADLRFWAAEHYGIEPKGQDLADAVLGAARAAPFHPVREYLDSLVWDGVPRVDRWLDTYLKADSVESVCASNPAEQARARTRVTRYLSLVGAMTLIQSVARVRDPGCKADSVLILEGDQGLLKSTALKTLYGAEWFSDTPIDLGSKDAYEGIRGVWCVEMAELDSLNKADATRAKAFFSSSVDRFRMPYGHRAQRFARQCVVAGTTNQHQYLKDQTGNRRYWPVACTDIDIAGLAEMRDQLWAEADHRYRAGEPWWPQADDRALFASEQQDRTDGDVWESLIQAYLHKRLDDCSPAMHAELFITAADVMSQALNMDPGAMRRPEQTRVGIIFQALGWRSHRPMTASGRTRGYRPGVAAIAAYQSAKGGPSDEPPF